MAYKSQPNDSLQHVRVRGIEKTYGIVLLLRFAEHIIEIYKHNSFLLYCLQYSKISASVLRPLVASLLRNAAAAAEEANSRISLSVLP